MTDISAAHSSDCLRAALACAAPPRRPPRAQAAAAAAATATSVAVLYYVMCLGVCACAFMSDVVVWPYRLD